MAFDWTTLALQAVNFLVLVWLLHRLLYRPVLAAIDRRRAAEARALEEAAETKRAAEAAQAHWQAEQESLEAERQTLRQEGERAAAERAQAVLSDARTEADRLIAQGRDTLEAERGAMAADIRREASRVARHLAERLLRDVAPEVGPEPFLERLDQRIAALPAPERAEMKRAAGTAGARLLVAPALSRAARQTWEKRLSERLDGLPVEIATDPDLIAGARLRLPTAVFDADWADALSEAEQRMAEDECAS